MLKKFVFSLYLVGVLLFLYGLIMENSLAKIFGLSFWAICATYQFLTASKKIKVIKKEFEIFNPTTGEFRMQQIPEGALNPQIVKLYVTNGEFVNKNDLLIEISSF